MTGIGSLGSSLAFFGCLSVCSLHCDAVKLWCGPPSVKVCVCARCVLVPAQPAAPAAAPRVVSATANVWESNATDYRRLCTGGPPVDTDRQTLWKRLASLYPGLSLPSRWSLQWKVLVVAVAASTDVFIRSPQLSLTLANLASSLSGDCLSYCLNSLSTDCITICSYLFDHPVTAET